MKQTMGPNFKVEDIVEHFVQLRSSNEDFWWRKCIEIDWSNVRSSINTKWISIRYKPKESPTAARLNLVIRNEKHIGQIMPLSTEDNTDKSKNDRDTRNKICVQIQKWSVPVRTQEDKITPIMENGKPVYPKDEYLSKYFQFIEFMQEIFVQEIDERTNRANKLMQIVKEAKNKVLALDTSENVAKLRQDIGHMSDGDTIILDTDYKSLKDKFKSCCNELLKGFIQVNNTKLFPLIQEYVSETAQRNKGCKLPNPITRVTIPFDTKTFESSILILDKFQESFVEGKRKFDNAIVDGQPVTALNINKFILSGSVIDGIINMDAICLSQLGISLPTKFKTIIVMPSVKKNYSVVDICTSIYGDEKVTVEVENNSEHDESTTSMESANELLDDL